MKWLRRLQEVKFRVLFASLLALTVLTPLTARAAYARGISDLLVQVALVCSVMAISDHRRLLWAASGLGVAAFGATGLFYLTDSESVMQAALLLDALFFAFLAGAFLVEILQSMEITTDRLFGALCVYVLLGIVWSFLHLSIYVANHEAYDMPAPLEAEAAAAAHTSHPADQSPLTTFIYFSFVTLTTLGYGDMHPLSQTARTASWLEAVVGQLFLAVLIARLVGLHLATAGKESADEQHQKKNSPGR